MLMIKQKLLSSTPKSWVLGQKDGALSQGKYRWLTVASPEEPEGTQLLLALNDNPAANAYQKAIFKQGIPAAQFFVSDIKEEYEKIKKLRPGFTMPPTKLPFPQQ